MFPIWRCLKIGRSQKWLALSPRGHPNKNTDSKNTPIFWRRSGTRAGPPPRKPVRSSEAKDSWELGTGKYREACFPISLSISALFCQVPVGCFFARRPFTQFCRCCFLCAGRPGKCEQHVRPKRGPQQSTFLACLLCSPGLRYAEDRRGSAFSEFAIPAPFWGLGCG